MAIAFEIGKTYDFTTLVGAQIGSIYKLMRVVSIMSVEEAMKYRDVIGLHKSLYPMLPTDTPLDANNLTFIGFRPEGNPDETAVTVLALEWINKDSIVEADGVTITVTIRRASTNDVAIISETIAALGHTDYEVKTS